MPAKTVLFLCTGNYYRSRFAEILFNALAKTQGLPWRAHSRGLALERGINNVGPISVLAVEALRDLGIDSAEFGRFPLSALPESFHQADLVIALKEDEHRPLLEERFPGWAEQVEFWDMEDAEGILPQIEKEVRQLVKRLKQ